MPGSHPYGRARPRAMLRLLASACLAPQQARCGVNIHSKPLYWSGMRTHAICPGLFLLNRRVLATIIRF